MSTLRSARYVPGWRLAGLGAIACWLAAPTRVFANAYWIGFKRFWSEYLVQVDGVVLVVIIVGIISLIIITRGKWLKS
jgi:hypothetical protein